MSTERTAIVTGAGGGIGTAVVSRLAADGFRVLALDTQFAKDAWANNPHRDRIELFPVDIGDTEVIEAFFTSLSERIENLDALVNCAGIMRRGNALEISKNDWLETIQINTSGLFFICRAAIPLLKRSETSAIANIASNWGLIPSAGHIAYNASKAAVVSLSRSLALDFGRDGIRVNAVCPGEILTPMVEKKLQANNLTESDLAKNIPIGRVGRPEDVAALMSYLVGPESSYVTGGAIEITGGLFS